MSYCRSLEAQVPSIRRVVLRRLLVLVKVGGDEAGAGVSLHRWLYTHLFAPWASPVDASLLFAVDYVLLWLAAMAMLYRQRIFIRV